MKPIRALLCALFLAAAPPLPHAAEVAAPARMLPGDSVYHLDLPLTDQDGHALRFAGDRGKPRLVSLFYSSCQFVCPMIVDTLKKTERELSDAERARLDVLLVSIDPDRDTPAALKRVAERHHVDETRWRLARADKPDVRRLAAVLGVQYKPLADGEFSHSSVLILLDEQGRIAARSTKLGDTDPEFVAAIRRTLAPGS